MKNLFISVGILLTASLSWAHTKTISRYVSNSPAFNRSVLFASFKDAMDENVHTETPIDSAKADHAKTYTPAAIKTANGFAVSQASASHYLVGTWPINDTM